MLFYMTYERHSVFVALSVIYMILLHTYLMRSHGADNNVLIEDTRAGIKYKSKDCGEALKSKGFKLSTTKIEYLGINLVKEGKEVKN